MSGYWGISPWGIGPWGVGVPTSLVPVTAYAAGDRFVRVTLASEPQHLSAQAEGDALNPTTWSITVPSTGRVLTVLSVVQQDTTTFDLLTLEEFETHFVEMEVSSTTLRNVAGIPTVTPIAATYRGVRLEATSTDERRTVTRRQSLVDLANPPATSNAPVGGTLQITSGGDYASVSGAELVKKLILRRLVSKPRDFWHLPDYGLGLRVKEPLPTNDLVKLKKQVEQQVQLEPEVDAVRAAVSYDYSAGALIIQLKVLLKKTGQQIEIGLPIPTGLVQI